MALSDGFLGALSKTSAASLCAPRHLLRLLAFLAVTCILVGTAWLWQNNYRSPGPIVVPHRPRPATAKPHPIEVLMNKAEAEWHTLMAKETVDLASTVDAYRKRRGRHPPPGFDKWFQFAREKKAVIVEDFFDQIYHDLTPFWGVESKFIRRVAKKFAQVVSVRNGTATQKSEKPREWVDLWHNLISNIAEWLPDVDVPINVMDESRIIVPWEDIDMYVGLERSSRKIVPDDQVVSNFTGLADVDTDAGEPYDLEFVPSAPYWDIARVACPPGSPSRDVPATTDFAGPPPVPKGFPERSFGGYVQNWTQAKDPCLQPDLRGSHGTFVEPISLSTTRRLFPMFGGSKLPMNNEILIPPAMYWSHRELYTGGDTTTGGPWDKKKDMVVWRGVASGGRNKAENWTRFQRHRFLSMINGTSLQLAEQNPEHPGLGPNFDLRPSKAYGLKTTESMDLSAWLDPVVDAGFTHLVCFPESGNLKCPYTDHFFSIQKTMPMKDMYNYKYLPDIDGNSFSGRYWGFLRSTSLPIKATIYAEWHDSRMVPWLHFVPMDNSFVDFYGILEYFMGWKDSSGAVHDSHDREAKKIALAGKEWAEKVLRRDDMLVYVMRLLLEYARICDDNREKLGFVVRS